MDRDRIIQIAQAILQRCLELLEKLKKQAAMNEQTDNSKKIYEIAKSLLGQHLTLDKNVSPDLGCAEAVSVCLKKGGVQDIPIRGFAGTRELSHFLLNSSEFVKVDDPSAGDVIISPTPITGIPHGHTGIVAYYGILSNDSDTGLFLERFSLNTWNRYYKDQLNLPVYFFRMI